jgi:nicotinamidase-related amidase/quinol monooxygenase YgiN
MSKFANVVTIEVAPGRRDQVVTLLLAHKARLNDEPGTLQFEVLLPKEDDTKVRVYEMYRDAAAFEEHLNGPSLAQWKDRDCRNGGEASRGAVRGRGLVGPLTRDRQPLNVVPTTAGVTAMNTPTYDKSISALLVVDPYNDFISEGGKIWPRIKAVAEANDCVSNMLKVLNAARTVKLRVFYAMHHRYRAGDYETWTYIAPIQRATWQHKSFEYGTWGGEFRAEFVPAPGEIVAQEHWCSSGFANTDLDLQLKKHGIHKLIVIGLIAHTCIEATVRYAAELGYEVTVVNDATADYSDEMMHAALDINIPNYASAIVTTGQIVASISAPT